MRRALIFGFGPFGEIDQNPSERLINELRTDNQQWPGWIVTWRVFTVDSNTIEDEIVHALRDVELAIGIGVRPSSTSVQLEQNAANLRIQQPGESSQDAQPANPAYPSNLATRLPVIDLHQILRNHGLPTELSTDAENYVCNFAYFHALAATAGNALFLHVPPATPTAGTKSEQVPSYHQVRQAVATVIDTLLTRKVTHGPEQAEAMEDSTTR
jgi:pyroglutamyl-peptidase